MKGRILLLFSGLVIAAAAPRVSAARTVEDRAREILQLERDRRDASDARVRAADTRRIERLERSARDAAGAELRSDLGEPHQSIREGKGPDFRVIDGREVRRTEARGDRGDRDRMRDRDGGDERRGLRDRSDDDDHDRGGEGSDDGRDGSNGGSCGDDGSGGGDHSGEH
jgi:hypothetical protein